ncbi:MAG: hypothetical protein ACE5JB_00360 [bacterium]
MNNFLLKLMPIKRMSDPGVIILVAVFTVSAFILLTPWIYGHGVGYYAWLRSLFFDGNLDCTNEFQHYIEIFQKEYGWQGVTDDLTIIRTETGLQSNKYQLGSAILWLPFFLIGHLITLLINTFGGNLAVDGYSKFYVLMISIGSALYGFIGLLLAYFLSRKFFSIKISLLASIGIWFASSTVFYIYLHPSLSHANEIFVVSLFIYYWYQHAIKGNSLNWAILGLIGGLMLAVRMENVVFCLLPFISLMKKLKENFTEQKREKYSQLLYNGLIFLGTLILGFLPQMLVWKAVYGKYILNSYGAHFVLVHPVLSNEIGDAGTGDTSFFKFLTHPHLFNTFFGSDKGLFLWTPIIIFSFIGLVILFKKERILIASLFITFFTFAYIVSCAGGGGASFGARYLVRCSLIFILGLAGFMSFLSNKLKSIYLFGFVLLFMIWNNFFIIQYATGMVNRAGPVNWTKMVRNQFTKVPQFLLTKGTGFLTERNKSYKNNN